MSGVGNWTTFSNGGLPVARTHSNVHEIDSIGGVALVHDDQGNLITDNTNGQSYTYDLDGRMDTATNGTDNLSYQYDALGRRVARTVGSSTRVFALAGQQVVAEYASGVAPASPLETYVYASYIDEPVLKEGTGGTVYYSRNQQYSITALTDAVGQVVERYAYSAYGSLTIMNAAGTVLSASTFGNPYT